MAIALVNSASGADADGLSVGPVDLAGSSLIVLAYVFYIAGTLTTPPNDGVNSYTNLRSEFPPDDSVVRIYYAENPTVSSPLTFTTSGSGIFNALIVAGFSGVKTSSPIDQHDGAILGSPSTSIQPGSVTPTEDNELIVAQLGYGDPIADLAINSGFSTPIHFPFESGVNFGVSFSYLVQTSLGAVNPQFSWSGVGSDAGTNIATFKAETGGPTPQLRGVIRPNLIWR